MYIQFSFRQTSKIPHDCSSLMLGTYKCLHQFMQYSVRHYSQSAHPSDLSLWANIKCRRFATAIRYYNKTLNKFLIMVTSTAVRYFKKKKQDAFCVEHLMHFSLKVICLASVFTYEKICNTPSKLWTYRAYQIYLYVL
jgi:hypothetical protein